MGLGRVALLVQLGTTLPLVGLIWLIQIVSYPLFARVGAAAFPAYHDAHARLITFVVGPLMCAELGAALAGLPWSDPLVPRAYAWAGAGLAIATWGFTLFVSVPLHEALNAGLDVRLCERLVQTNWLRTAAWTARGILLLGIVARGLRPS